MSTSYAGSLLDHLAEYMIYLSTASSFRFSLDSSYDHEFHLSQQLEQRQQTITTATNKDKRQQPNTITKTNDLQKHQNIQQTIQ